MSKYNGVFYPERVRVPARDLFIDMRNAMRSGNYTYDYVMFQVRALSPGEHLWAGAPCDVGIKCVLCGLDWSEDDEKECPRCTHE